MAKSVVSNIQFYATRSDDRFFIDTNVWIDIHATPPELWEDRQRNYSGFLKALMKKKLPIFVDLIVVSEFVNVYTRLEHSRTHDPIAVYRV